MSKFDETKLIELMCKDIKEISQADSEYLMAWFMNEDPAERMRIMQKANAIDLNRIDLLKK